LASSPPCSHRTAFPSDSFYWTMRRIEAGRPSFFPFFPSPPTAPRTHYPQCQVFFHFLLLALLNQENFCTLRNLSPPIFFSPCHTNNPPSAVWFFLQNHQNVDRGDLPPACLLFSELSLFSLFLFGVSFCFVEKHDHVSQLRSFPVPIPLDFAVGVALIAGICFFSAIFFCFPDVPPIPGGAPDSGLQQGVFLAFLIVFGRCGGRRQLCFGRAHSFFSPPPVILSPFLGRLGTSAS